LSSTRQKRGAEPRKTRAYAFHIPYHVPSEVNVVIMDDLLRWKWSPGSLPMGELVSPIGSCFQSEQQARPGEPWSSPRRSHTPEQQLSASSGFLAHQHQPRITRLHSTHIPSRSHRLNHQTTPETLIFLSFRPSTPEKLTEPNTWLPYVYMYSLRSYQSQSL
jgi:hypothetical protein